MGLVALLVAGGAAEVLQVSLNCPLPLQRTHPLALLIYCFLFLRRWELPVQQLGSCSRREVNLFLSEKQGGNSHFIMIPISADLEIWRSCVSIRCCLYL